MKSLLELKSDKDFINTYEGAFFNPEAKGRMAFARLSPFFKAVCPFRENV